MFFGFDDDQLAIREAVAAFFEHEAGLGYLQQAWSDPTCDDVWKVWSGLAEMGVQGLLAPEHVGGSGLGWVSMALVLAEAGRVAFPLPLLETAAIGVPILGVDDPAGLLPSLIDGSEVLTVRPSPSAGALVPAASRATLFLLEGRLYRREEVTLEEVASVDRTRDTARVVPRGSGSAVAAGGGEAAELGALGASAVLIGLGRAMLDMTVGYVKERKQFGAPIGSFQAVKHHLADAAMHLEMAAPAVWAAAWQFDHGSDPAEKMMSVSLAKALASDAASLAGRKALQCHGAMGYTIEYGLHLWLKRVWCLSASYGTAGWHRRRIAAGLGLVGT